MTANGFGRAEEKSTFLLLCYFFRTFELRSKALSLEKTKENVVFFCFLAASSYL